MLSTYGVVVITFQYFSQDLSIPCAQHGAFLNVISFSFQVNWSAPYVLSLCSSSIASIFLQVFADVLSFS